MFGKLLKHDFRASWPLLGTLSLICLGAGATGAVVIRTLDTDPKDFVMWLCVMGMFAVTLYLMGYILAAGFVLLSRFYKSRFTDEGYLTFTLPVTTHQILLSSALNCFLGMLLAIAVTTLAFGIFLFFGTSSLDGERLEFIKVCFQKLPTLIDMAGAGNLFMILLAMLAAMANEVLCIMLAITLAAVLAKKHRVLMGVAAYYGIHALVNLSGILVGRKVGNAFPSGVLIFLESKDSLLAGIFGVITLGLALTGAAYYFLMYYLVHKKLNLN